MALHPVISLGNVDTTKQSATETAHWKLRAKGDDTHHLKAKNDEQQPTNQTELLSAHSGTPQQDDSIIDKLWKLLAP